MSCRFTAPVLVDVPHQVQATFDSVDGDRLSCSARVTTADVTLCAEGSATFVAVGAAEAARAAGGEVREEHCGYLGGGAGAED